MGPVGRAHHRDARERDGRRLPPVPPIRISRPTTLRTSGSIPCARSCPSCPTRRRPFEDAFGLSAYDARHLVEHRAADFFEACMELAGADAAEAGEAGGEPRHQRRDRLHLNAHEGVQLADTPLTPARACARASHRRGRHLVQAGQEVFAAVLDEDKDPAAIVEERGMKQVSDTRRPSKPSSTRCWPPTPTRWRSTRAARPVSSGSSWASA